MNIVEAMISGIAPHKCIICGDNGDLLCQPCLYASISAPPSRCYRCHAVSPQSQVCGKCRRSTTMRHVWVASDYQDAAKMLIHNLKFERANLAAKPLARAIENILPDLPPNTLVVHVPTANKRVRVRGYDQAQLIAKEVAQLRGWQHRTFLMRQGKTRQVGSDRQSRFDQIESALLPVRLDQIKNAQILLIDDVTTTGATLEAAAKVLKSVGAKSVDAAVFAQPIY